MARIEKTVFISYRRTDVYTALAVYENLKNQGFDVFFDYRSISSGDFEQIITSNIKARAHFLLILTSTALDRCNEPGDWLRREIEIAMDEKRNIIPLFFKGFRFGFPLVTEKLTGKLKSLSRYNGLNVHEDYFEEAMHRLRTQYLNIPLDTVLHPVSSEVQKLVREEQVAADRALEQIENVKELAKQAEEKPDQPIMEPDQKPNVKSPPENILEQAIETAAVPTIDSPSHSDEILNISSTGFRNAIAGRLSALKKMVFEFSMLSILPLRNIFFPHFNFHLLGRFGVAALLLMLFIWAGVLMSENKPGSIPDPKQTSKPSDTGTPSQTKTLLPTSTKEFETTNTPSPTRTSIASRPALGIGSTMTGKDGMTLLYVPAGEFTMGSTAEDALAECQKWLPDCVLNELKSSEPPHKVFLDSFWIDQTEVTNKMYSLCEEAGVCREPIKKSFYANSIYYGDSDFDNYPVIYVTWYMAKTYCQWTGRRLPTEAEWEKAARSTDERTYPWGNEIPNSNLVNAYGLNGAGEITSVGRYPAGASPYGALDMAGNVQEWVEDWYKDVYYTSAPHSNPFGPDSGRYRVVRGGAWAMNNQYDLIRSAYRWREDPGLNDYFTGFRCAMSATP